MRYPYVTIHTYGPKTWLHKCVVFLYVEKISKLKFSTFISQVTSLGYVIPGAVIGLGVILLFTKVPMLNSFSLVGSFYVLIYAYVFRFLAVGKSPIKSSLEKQPDSYDDTAKTLGLGPFRILQKIHFPINRLALITAFIVTRHCAFQRWPSRSV